MFGAVETLLSNAETDEEQIVSSPNEGNECGVSALYRYVERRTLPKFSTQTVAILRDEQQKRRHSIGSLIIGRKEMG